VLDCSEVESRRHSLGWVVLGSGSPVSARIPAPRHSFSLRNKNAGRLVARRAGGAYPWDVRRAAYIVVALAGMCASNAQAELVARSRNSVVFVESTRAGEEWQAFRVVDARHPGLYRVEGPGRVLLKLRTLSKVDSSAAEGSVLNGDEIVMAVQVPSTADTEAQLSDGGGRAALAKLYLLTVGPGVHRVTVRHDEGPALLVSARFAPPLRTEAGDQEVPLVAPGAASDKPTVPRVGALQRGGNSLAAGPMRPAPENRTIRAPLPDGDGQAKDSLEPAPSPPAVGRGPSLGDEFESHPAYDEGMQMQTRRLNNPARMLLEVRGGLSFDRIISQPGFTLGADFRGAVLGARRPRMLTLGVSLDIAHAQGPDPVVFAGTPIDVATLRHTIGVLAADARLRLLRYGDAASVYASLGGGVMLGRAVLRSARSNRDAGSTGYVGALRLGATLGVEGSRPFLEVRGWVGRLNSAVLRPGPEHAAGASTGWYAMAVTVGWRVELGFEEQR